MKKLTALALVLITLASLFVGCGKSTSGEVVLPEIPIEDTMENRQKAIEETGLAYYRKNQWQQYDYLTMNALGRYFGIRAGGNGDNTPEYASEYRTIYNTCTPYSYFCNYNTFGFELMGGIIEATDIDALPKGENPDGTKIPECIFVHWNSAETLEEDAKVAAEVKSWLQPGDIVSYRRYGDHSGHTLIYVSDLLNGDGVNDIVNYDGKYYDGGNLVDVREKNAPWGPVEINAYPGSWPSGDYFLFDPTSSQYLGGADPAVDPDAVHYYSVVRITDKPEQYPMTPAAKTRLLYPGMDIYFNAPQGHFGSVTKGEELTYTLVVQNRSGEKVEDPRGWVRSDYLGQAVNYEKILVQIPVPAGTELVSVNGKAVKTDLVKFTMNVAAGDTVAIPVTVKATGNVGDRIVMDGAYLHGIPLPKTVTVIRSAAVDGAAVYNAASANTDKTGIEFANAVYAAMGKPVNLPEYADLKKGLFDEKRVGDQKLSEQKETYDEAMQSFAKMMVPNFVGGLYYNDGVDSEQVKEVRARDLEAGDILVWEELKGFAEVAVHDGEKLLCVKGGKLVTLEQEDLDRFYKYRFFVAFRPVQAQ